ncbi:MAG: hypothetical protein LBO00_00620 [Zoogloeaceae bacterium]|nr:hypothetical protein [Zoogloeaceae bacterium]
MDSLGIDGRTAGERRRCHGYARSTWPTGRPGSWICYSLDSIRLIARLGGFPGRKSDGGPDARIVWLGMRDIAVFANGIRAVRDGRRV